MGDQFIDVAFACQAQSIGVRIQCAFTDAVSGSVIDVSGATSLEISVQEPNGNITQTVPAAFVTDGKDGLIYYQTQSTGDVPEEGYYQYQGSALAGAVPFQLTPVLWFKAEGNVAPGTPTPPAPVLVSSAFVLYDGDGVRWVTTMNVSGALNAPVAIGYVRHDLTVPGTALRLQVRGRSLPAQVVTLPFVPHRYLR